MNLPGYDAWKTASPYEGMSSRGGSYDDPDPDPDPAECRCGRGPVVADLASGRHLCDRCDEMAEAEEYLADAGTGVR